MKYKHAFLIGLPFTVFGIGKALHKFRMHHGGCCGSTGEHRHGHMLKLLSWRLGLSAEQQSKLNDLMKKTHGSMDGMKSKREKFKEFIVNGFSKEKLDPDEIQNVLEPGDFEQLRTTFTTVLSEFHKILTPLQREKVQKHFMNKMAHGCHWC
jgi:Spy/CpxP family protein refolding chaperone